MKNRGTVSSNSIAEKLRKVEQDLGIQEQDKILNNPLLFVNGRLDRKNCQYVAKNFALLEQLDKEIKLYCKGVDLTILNYLVYLGLENIKKDNKFISLEYSDIENKINLK